jgi:hypothetical protein
MITFDQTLDAVERILEHLKSVAELENMIDHLEDNLNDFSSMLEFAHQRRLTAATEHTQRLLANLELVTGESSDSISP